MMHHPSIPKYIKLAEHLKKQIESGVLKPGDRLPSFSEVRERFAVSQHTLEKAHGYLEKDKLIKREQGKGVFVAQPQPSVGTKVIAFYGPDAVEVQHPYWTHILQGIQSGARELGLEVVLPNGIIPAVGWAQIEGVLLMSSELDWMVDQLPPGMPYVTLLKPLDRVFSSSVVTDDYAGAKSAVDYLISLGHRRIGYLISGYAEWNQTYDHISKQRLDGYRAALSEAGIPPDPGWVRHFQLHSKNSFADAAYASLQDWLKAGRDPFPCTALLAHNDDAAIGVMRAFREAGFAVPQQMSVVGFDGTEMSQLVNPQLTTVKVPLEEVGREGAKALWRLVHHKSAPRETVTLPTSLVVRESTAPPDPIQGG